MKRKFKRGNLVEATKPFKKEKDKAIIEYTYAEKYGGYNHKDYSIIWLDTGNSHAWKREHQLTFLDKGGEHLFKEAEKNRQIYLTKQLDINYIKNNLDTLSSQSILHLFDLLGYDSYFHENGELFTLKREWDDLYPIFLKFKTAENIEEVKEMFNSEIIENYNIEKVWNLFKSEIK